MQGWCVIVARVRSHEYVFELEVARRNIPLESYNVARSAISCGQIADHCCIKQSIRSQHEPARSKKLVETSRVHFAEIRSIRQIITLDLALMNVVEVPRVRNIKRVSDSDHRAGCKR